MFSCISFRGDVATVNDNESLDIFKKTVDEIVSQLPDQYPNWGALRRLPLGRRYRKSCNSAIMDHWTRTPLKSKLVDGGLVRY